MGQDSQGGQILMVFLERPVNQKYTMVNSKRIFATSHSKFERAHQFQIQYSNMELSQLDVVVVLPIMGPDPQILFIVVFTMSTMH